MSRKKDEIEWLTSVKECYGGMTKEEKLKCLFTHSIFKRIPKNKRKEAVKLMVPHLKKMKKIIDDMNTKEKK